LKKVLAAAAVACLAGLTACSAATPAPEVVTSADTPVTSSTAPSLASPSRSASASAPAGKVKQACELFNSLFAEYRASEPTTKAYVAIYSKAWKAKDEYTGNLRGLLHR
jgi:hypothetical protein